MIFRALPLLLAAAAASAQDRSVPPIGVPPAPAPPAQVLIQLTAGEARCDGGPVQVVRLEAPLPVSAFGNGDNAPQPVTLSFRIDAEGRPLSIVRTDGPPGEWRQSHIYYENSDVIPAFAVSRFAPGVRSNCTIRFDARAWSTTEAPLALVQRYFVAPHQRQPGEQALFRRMHPANTDCIGAGSPRLRLRAFPAFEAIPIPPGAWAHAMTGFDIDARGRPANVRILGSDRNSALDRASIKAVRQSRYAPEARHGCTYPYYRRSDETIAAPVIPDKESLRPAGAHCSEGDTGWTSMPKLTFPAGFESRRIEGWAIVGYDVAPWGQIGNVRVLAAEPAAAFGERARDIVGSARQATSPTGRSGCVDIVRFVMPQKGQEAPDVDG